MNKISHSDEENTANGAQALLSSPADIAAEASRRDTVENRSEYIHPLRHAILGDI